MNAVEPIRQARKIVIDPVTRVEGHGKVTLHLDDAGKVTQARLHIVEFRGFERFVQGRPYWEVPVIIQHLCGICPVSHHLAASKAMDIVAGVDAVTPSAEKLRRLMHYGQIVQSNALHIFHLASPDLLFGFGANVADRNIFAVMEHFPNMGKWAILIRKFGQEVIKATGGKKIHPRSSVPGGVNKNLALADRDALRKNIDEVISWSQQALVVLKEAVARLDQRYNHFAVFDSNYLSLVGADGRMDLYDGGLRAMDADGKILFDHIPADRYEEKIAEHVRPWTFMKFPYFRDLGEETGWYRVGPLAQVSCADYIDTPLAEAERRAFVAQGHGRPVNASLSYHWARMICVIHAAEKIKELLFDDDLQGTDLLVRGEQRRRSGAALLEAPRGVLYHHYEVGDDDLVTAANLIVSTASNNEAMNRAVRSVANDYLSGHEITDPLLNHIEVAIRAYDPCLSCATHALGQMPLIVTLKDASGAVVAERVKDAGAA